MTKAEIGKLGEQYVCEYIKENGFTVVRTNYHSRYGEIDIIAQDERYILFIEVKTRAKDSLVNGLEAVNLSKMRKLLKTAWCWLRENPSKLQPRFDVCEVVTQKANDFTPINIVHIKNAFGAEVANESF